MKIVLHKNLKRLSYFIFIILFCLFALELCFRYQIIDFYQLELEGLNTEKELVSEKNNILIFGDSFTAHPDSYVKHLRNNLANYNFINSAIPGTGIKQHELIFNSRIKKYQPKAVIYQFYVGNDFSDIKHPINYKELSLLRNLFWKISESFLVLQYINHRFAFLNSNNQPIKKLQEKAFSEDLYNHRVKTYYKGNKSMLNNTILLSDNNVKSIYKKWKEKLFTLKEIVGDSIPTYLLIIPHNAQVNKIYLEQNINLGAEVSTEILNATPPLFYQIKNDFNKWQVINPLPQLQKNNNSDKLYYQNDPHFTAYGQKELAKIILKELPLKDE